MVLRRSATVVLLVWLAMLAPWTAQPAHAADLGFADPEHLVVGEPGGSRFMIPPDPADASALTFGGHALGAPDQMAIRVEVFAFTVPFETELEVCSTPSYPNDATDITWECAYSVDERGPIPSAYRLEARMFIDEQDEPTLVAPLENVAILNSPDHDASRVSTQESTVTLSGTRLAGMGVEVHPGRLSAGSPEAGASEPVCTDAGETTETWSCTFDLPDDTVGTHGFSARHVPIDAVTDTFEVASGFRWVEVERAGSTTPDSDPGPSADPVSGQDPGPGPGPDSAAGTDPPAPANPEPASGLVRWAGPDLQESSAVPGIGPDRDRARASPGRLDARAATDDAGPSAPTPWEEPTAYGTGLRSPSDLADHPIRYVTAALLTAVSFLLLVTIPAELLYSTLRKNYDRAFGWAAGLRRTWSRFGARWRTSALRRLAPVLVLLTGAALGTLAEANLTSWPVAIRLYLAVLVSLVIMNGAAALTAWGVAGRRYRLPTRLVLMPAFLVLAAASVLVSRVFELQPGILFGLLMTVVVVTRLDRGQAGRTAAAGCAGFLVLGIVAWFLYSAIDVEATGFGTQVLREALTTITIGGIGSVIIALLPITFLDGRTVFEWSRGVWAALYTVAVAAFMLIVAPLPESWVEASLRSLLWSGVFGAFGLAAVSVWAWFRFRPTPGEPVPDRVPVS
ncbi:hypothetical protein [Aeromicrobium sp. CTD01-1L150]|uniref:hypothetical protein n=1 Tax=Aeromicrobium sp. CTD01-1L150 TaxID=3341830 RepID=UPI0035BF1AC7